MRPVLRATALLSALTFSLSVLARAETVDFSISGVDQTSTPYTATFAIDTSTYFADFTTFAYEGVAVTTNGVTESLDVDFTSDEVFESVSFFGSNYLPSYIFPDRNGVLPLTGDAQSGLPPTVNPGTYGGTVQCIASVTMPQRAPGMMATLGLLQMPTLDISCGEAATLTVGGGTVTPPPPTPPTSVTPEPATIGLLGTGALGLIGLVRRRFQSSTR